MSPATGYAHPDYARVYQRIGEPIDLLECGGTLLRRRIPGTEFYDLTGCYPLFSCTNWPALGSDIAALKKANVSVVLVADPFFDGGDCHLRQTFEVVRPFKTHYIADLSKPLHTFVPASRIRSAHKALRKLDTKIVCNPAEQVDSWMELQEQSRYAARSSGVNCLSRGEVERLFRIPGITVFLAVHQGHTVGMHVEFQQGDVVFGHFATYSPAAYRLNVSTVLHLFEMEYFMGRARWIDWGGVPGIENAQTGLSRFKQDFSNTTRLAFLCGSVFDQRVYEKLSAPFAMAHANYFPAYRIAHLDRPLEPRWE